MGTLMSNMQNVTAKTYLGILVLLALSLVLTSCSSVPVQTVHANRTPMILEILVELHDNCDPPRGDDQSPEVRVHGHALDSLPTGCI